MTEIEQLKRDLEVAQVEMDEWRDMANCYKSKADAYKKFEHEAREKLFRLIADVSVFASNNEELMKRMKKITGVDSGIPEVLGV